MMQSDPLQRFRLARCINCGYDLVMAQTPNACPGCDGPGSDALLVQAPIRPVQAGLWILIAFGFLFIFTLPFAIYGIIYILRGLPRKGINHASGAAVINEDSLRYLRDHTKIWVTVPWSAVRDCRVQRALIQGDTEPPLSEVDRWQLLLRFHDPARKTLKVEFRDNGDAAIALRTAIQRLYDETRGTDDDG